MPADLFSWGAILLGELLAHFPFLGRGSRRRVEAVSSMAFLTNMGALRAIPGGVPMETTRERVPVALRRRCSRIIRDESTRPALGD
jgi:hypothetical protein